MAQKVHLLAIIQAAVAVELGFTVERNLNDETERSAPFVTSCDDEEWGVILSLVREKRYQPEATAYAIKVLMEKGVVV